MSPPVRVIARDAHEPDAGALFEIEPHARGWAPHRFGG